MFYQHTDIHSCAYFLSVILYSISTRIPICGSYYIEHKSQQLHYICLLYEPIVERAARLMGIQEDG